MGGCWGASYVRPVPLAGRSLACAADATGLPQRFHCSSFHRMLRQLPAPRIGLSAGEGSQPRRPPPARAMAARPL